MEEATDLQCDIFTWITCGFGHFLLYFGLNYSSALLVILTIEKFIALYFPFKTKTLCTVRIAKRASLVSALIFAFYCSQFAFFSIELTDDYGVFCWYGNVSWNYLSILFGMIDATLNVYGPFIIIFLSNSAIVYKFISVKWRNRHGGTESTSQALSKSATKGAAMLLTVSFVFIILKLPIVVANRVWPDGTIPDLIYKSFIALEYSNHGINGMLYCVSGSRFRNELKILFTCGKKSGLNYGSSWSTGANSTSMSNIASSTNPS